MKAHACLGGKVMPLEQATVSVEDRGLLHGDGIFEVLRAVSGRPVDLDWHLERLASGAAMLELPAVPASTWQSELRATLAVSGAADAHVRLMLSRGSGDVPTRVVIVRAMTAEELRPPPVDAAIVPVHRDPFLARWKTLNHLPSVLATQLAKKRGAGCALMTGLGGDVVEAANASLFVVLDGRLATPPIASGCLDGITRRRVVALAAAAGMPTSEVSLRPETVRAASEVFVTSSVRGVVAVRKVDGLTMAGGAPGPVTRALGGRYAAFLADCARAAL